MAAWLRAARALVGLIGCWWVVGCGHDPVGANGTTAGGGGGESAGTAGTAGATDPCIVLDDSYESSLGELVTVKRSSVPYDQNPTVTTAEFRSVITSLNDFGLDLGRQLSTQHENFVFSPLSLSTVLTYAYAGALGTTADEIRAALHLALDDATFHRATNRLWCELRGRVGIKLKDANAIWIQSGLVTESSYLDLLARNYQAALYEADFTNQYQELINVVNQWGSLRTDGAIPDCVDSSSVNGKTRFLLMNTLLFEGHWDEWFYPSDTEERAFNLLDGSTVTPLTMGAGFRALSWMQGNGYQLGELDYTGSELTLTIVLPDEGRFDEVVSLLSSVWLDEARSELSVKMLDILLPKWNFSTSQDFGEYLKSLGIVTASDPNQADFGGLVPDANLALGVLRQQARIALDESGTWASAATIGELYAPTAVTEAEGDFVVDRPFVFFIRDKTGALVFAGQVMDPTR